MRPGTFGIVMRFSKAMERRVLCGVSHACARVRGWESVSETYAPVSSPERKLTL